MWVTACFICFPLRSPCSISQGPLPLAGALKAVRTDSMSLCSWLSASTCCSCSQHAAPRPAAACGAMALCQPEPSQLSCKALKVELGRLNLHRALDKDGDGKISKVELDEMFSKIDANKDGLITFEEWHDYLTKSGLSREKCEALEAIFRQLDADGSGGIDRSEFEAHFHYDYGARYARSVITAFLTKGRFIAYTSDIGESARPVMPSWFVNGA